MAPLHRFDGPTMTIVVNPSAGRGRARRVLPKVIAELVQGLPDTHLQVHQASSFDDARLRTIQAVERARPAVPGGPADSLVVVGGDGMAHLGVNACAGTDVALGIIPAGTGNDFCRGMGIPTALSAATRTLIDGRVGRVDVMLAEGDLADGAQRRYVGCTVSTGYDARVNVRANAITLPLGPLAYGYVALAELATFDPLRYRIEVDGEHRELPAMLVAVSNSVFFGGGMRIAPGADVHDGLVDVTIIHPVSRMTLLRLLPTLYTGGFLKDPAVEVVRARSARIDGDELVGMADGEALGQTPLTVTAQPGALRVHLPRERSLPSQPGMSDRFGREGMRLPRPGRETSRSAFSNRRAASLRLASGTG